MKRYTAGKPIQQSYIVHLQVQVPRLISYYSFTYTHCRDGNSCQFCYRTVLSPPLRTVEHLVPKVQGGENVFTNLVTCCWDCNQAKGPASLVGLRWNEGTSEVMLPGFDRPTGPIPPPRTLPFTVPANEERLRMIATHVINDTLYGQIFMELPSILLFSVISKIWQVRMVQESELKSKKWSLRKGHYVNKFRVS